MLDISVAYNRYKFIGYEFLTWLWFMIEHDSDQLHSYFSGTVNFSVGNRIILENTVHDTVETITIKGDDAGLEEGMLALSKGAMVIEMHLRITEAEQEWQLTLKGESFNITNFKVPETGQVENSADVEGAVLEKYFLYEKAVKWLDTVFGHFISLRLSREWNDKVVSRIKKWIIQ